jgi:hypothetical protein
MVSEWCDFNDMPESGCSHCTGADKRADEAESTDSMFPFAAKYPGTCKACSEPIVVGEIIFGGPRAGYAHEEC